MFSDEQKTAIRNPYRIDADQVILHLWVLPMMRGTANGWTIFNGFRRDEEEKPVKVQRVRLNWLRARKPLSESLVIQKATLNTPIFLKHIAQARQIPIPLIGVKMSIQIDGVIHGIQMGNEYGGFSLTWWDTPAEWQPIHKWCDTFTRYLDTQINQKYPRVPKQG